MRRETVRSAMLSCPRRPSTLIAGHGPTPISIVVTRTMTAAANGIHCVSIISSRSAWPCPSCDRSRHNRWGASALLWEWLMKIMRMLSVTRTHTSYLGVLVPPPEPIAVLIGLLFFVLLEFWTLDSGSC